MLVALSINSENTAREIETFIKTSLTKTGFNKLVIGLSGGVDSATSTGLAVAAIGSQNIEALILPYGDLNRQGRDDAQSVVKFLDIPQQNVHLFDIKKSVENLASCDRGMDKLRLGNIAVRTRMILLYDLAKKYNALVLGTENKTEYLLGYFTRFGDEASDIEPLIGLYKTQVRQLAQYLRLPQKIINKAPTAGMWQGQTDEGELGFTYETADQILYLTFDKKHTKKQIVKQGFPKEIIDKVLNRAEENKFKHKLPYST